MAQAASPHRLRFVCVPSEMCYGIAFGRVVCACGIRASAAISSHRSLRVVFRLCVVIAPILIFFQDDIIDIGALARFTSARYTDEIESELAWKLSRPITEMRLLIIDYAVDAANAYASAYG